MHIQNPSVTYFVQILIIDFTLPGKRGFVPAIPIENLALRSCYLCSFLENSKLKAEMERGFVNSHQCYGSLDDRKVKHKYHCLLEDFLELQKEFVSKKRKLQTQKQKREMLVEEVRFLRQRYNYLTKSPLNKVESELCVNQNADIPDVPIRRDLNYIINKVKFSWKPESLGLCFHSISLTQSIMEQEGTGREVLVWMKPCIKKKLNNCLADENKTGKRQISWQDKVALGV